ncbi:unnamed protein product [Ectocarpus sp. 6 AP-2014]
MRAFVAPTILFSIARRSCRGLAVGASAAGRLPGCRTTASSCTVKRAASTETAATSLSGWPRRLDPDNCKVADIRQQLRRRGYTPPRDRQTKAALLEELRGLVRAEGFAPPDAVVRNDTVTGEGPGGAEGDGKARQRWNPEAGWVDRATMERGERGYPLCRFCNEEVPSARRTFCSDACVHEHRIRTQESYVRKCLLVRDGGQCAECGVDAAGLYKRARAAWICECSVVSKREAVALEMVGTPFEGKMPTKGMTRRPTQGKFWHADHIVPVVRGGGQCSLKNYRTLCVPCHAAATKRLAGERAAERARAAAAAAVASDSVAGTGAVVVKKKRGRPRKVVDR